VKILRYWELRFNFFPTILQLVKKGTIDILTSISDTYMINGFLCEQYFLKDLGHLYLHTTETQRDAFLFTTLLIQARFKN
jgi:hypothetical protein